MEDKLVSIIIPSYNRPEELIRVLPFYFKQKFVGEIIVVDDASVLSYEKAIEFGNRCANKFYKCFVYIRNEINLGAGGSRNIGIKNSRFDYILWGEDDAFLGEDYILKLSEHVFGHKAFAFGAIYYGITPEMQNAKKEELILKQQSSKRKLFNFDLFEGYYRKLTKEPIELPFGHALILVNKDVYSEIKYYEGYKVNGYREETDAQVQMLTLGYTGIYDSSVCCYHFPAQKKSGQHTKSRLTQLLYTIINNNIFLSRHFDTLKSKYNLKGNRAYFSIKFIINMFCVFIYRVLKKVLNRVL